MSENEFRYCIWCGVDCYIEPEPDHKPTCPQSTGLYPVTARDLEPDGMVCLDCEVPFAVGDIYTLRSFGVTPSGIPSFQVMCPACEPREAVG